MTVWHPIPPGPAQSDLPPVGVPVLVTIGHIFKPEVRDVFHAVLVETAPPRWASAATMAILPAVVRPVVAWAETPEPWRP